MQKRIIGIDYSLTSPSLCIYEGKQGFENHKIFYLTDKKKCEGVFSKNIRGELMPEYSSPQQRYLNICNWALDKINKNDIIFIEGYSMNSRVGRLFDIAENTSILKFFLWKENIEFYTFAPTEIKKFATGKGNANKKKLEESFKEETNLDIKRILFLTEKQDNPSSDIIDSYYICKLGVLRSST